MYEVTLYDLVGRPMNAREVKALQYNDGGVLLSLDGQRFDEFYPYHRVCEVKRQQPKIKAVE